MTARSAELQEVILLHGVMGLGFKVQGLGFRHCAFIK
jgi:hypothetical protein